MKMDDDPIKRASEFDGTLRTFLATAKSAGWVEPEEQVRSILVCVHQLVDDGLLPPDTIEKLFWMLEALAIAEHGKG
jgi:hypothetical protein